MQLPDGLSPRHDSAVPTDTVPDGHVVATVILGVSIAMYPDGHDVDGAAENDATGINKNKNINFFICTPV